MISQLAKLLLSLLLSAAEVCGENTQVGICRVIFTGVHVQEEERILSDIHSVEMAKNSQSVPMALFLLLALLASRTTLNPFTAALKCFYIHGPNN